MCGIHAGARAQPEAPAAPRRPAIYRPSVHVDVACVRHVKVRVRVRARIGVRVRVRVRVRVGVDVACVRHAESLAQLVRHLLRGRGRGRGRVSVRAKVEVKVKVMG